MKESWEDVVGYKGYYKVSSLGRVKSLDRTITNIRGVKRFIKGKLLKQSVNELGYLRVGLSRDCKMYTKYVHRVVSEAFIKNPRAKSYVNHKNSDRKDNRRVNLEWCTASENVLHSYTHGSSKRAENHPKAVLSNVEVLEIDLLLKYNLTHVEIADMYDVKESVINSINRGRSWNSLTNRKGKGPKTPLKGEDHPGCRKVINCRGKVFNTIYTAAKEFNINSASHISRPCREGNRTCGKYQNGDKIKWKYTE